MATFISVLLFIGGLLYLGTRLILFPSLTKDSSHTVTPIVYSWLIACLSFSALFGVYCIYYICGYFLPGMDDPCLFSGECVIYLIIGAVALLLMPFFRNKSLPIQLIALFAFFLIGSTCIPAPAYMNPWLFYILSALVWTGICLIQTIIDRIPLISYICNSAITIILALASSSLFNMLPPVLFFLFLSALFIHMLIFGFMKKANMLFEFFPIIFLMNWIIGYGFITFAAQGHLIYLPIFFGYSLMETGLILITRLLFKNKLPLFTVEKAFSNGAPVKAVTQKVFYAILLLGLISLAGMKSEITTKYCLVVYGMALIVLYNLYLTLIHNMTKVTLRSSLQDIMMGFKTLLNVGQSWVKETKKEIDDKNFIPTNTNGTQSTSSKTMPKASASKTFAHSKKPTTERVRKPKKR